MTLRHLVPALGLAALTIAPAFSADAVPSVTFAGWSDNVLSFSDSDTNATGPDNDPSTAKDDGAASLRFSSAASLKALWNITDRVHGKINLWFYPGTSTGGDPAATPTSTYSSNSNLNVREMYLTLDLTNGFTLQVGKSISHLGWLSAEPTGLYVVNASFIGYTELYGNDVLGGAVIWHDPDKSPWSAQFHVTNGYYTGSDSISPGYNAAPSAQRENSDLGVGFGLTYELPDDKGNIDFDLAYDRRSGRNGTGAPPGTTSMGGDALMIGLNATLKMVPNLLLGAEVMHFIVGDSEAAPSVVGPYAADGFARTQGMLTANYAFPGAPANMSVTGMVQYITQELDTKPATPATTAHNELGISAALLANPFPSNAFVMLGEIGYYERKGIGYSTGPGSKEDGYAVSVEFLGSF